MKAKPPVVYIIDDDQVIILLHKVQLKKQLPDQPIYVFCDARAGLESIVSLDSGGQKILIFLDINMPEMNGWEFLDQLQKHVNFSDIKVVIVTSSLSKSDKDKSLEYPLVIDYWEKPMAADQLIILKNQFGDWLKVN